MKSNRRKRKIRQRWIACILTIVMALTILPSNAINSLAEAFGDFTFIVTDEETNPVEGATVTIAIGEEELASGATDENGSVVLDVVYTGGEENPALSYTITKDGYAEAIGADAIDTTMGWSQEIPVTLTELSVITEGDYVKGETSWEYDGQAHEFIVTADGFEVQYGEYNEDPSAIVYGSTPFSLTAVGETKVSVKLSKAGYADLILDPITLTVTKASADKFAFETQNAADIIFRAGVTFENAAISSIESVDVTYALKDVSMEAIAQVDSNGVVTFLTPGTVTVVATMDAGQANNYESGTVEYTVTALDPATLVHFTTSTIVELVYDANNTAHKNEVVFESGLNRDDFELHYEITSETRDDNAIEPSDNVADIDTEGNVTIYSAGKVTIKLTLSKDGEEDIVLTYDLVINRADLSDFTFGTEAPDEIVYGESYTYSAMSPSVGEGTVTYNITAGAEFIMLDDQTPGKVIVLRPGTATITATRAADDKYAEKIITFEITVVKAEQTDFEFVFENLGDTDYKVTYGTESLTVVTTGGQSTEAVKFYIVGSTDIATINEDTGEITFASGKEGTFMIKAVKIGDDFYNDKEITCEVTVLNGRFDGTDCVIYQNNLIGENVWNTQDVTFTAKEGYKISRSDALDAEWVDVITIVAVEENLQIYVRNEETQAISNPVVIGKVNVDKATPTDLEIEYVEASIVDILLEGITFGFYESALEVTLKATDIVSGIKFFKYDLGDGEIVVNADDLQFNGSTASYTFTISPFYMGNIRFTAVDNAGWESSLDSGHVIIDDDVPGITIDFDNNSALNGIYFSDDRTATIKIVEKDFHKENVKIVIGKGTTEADIVETILESDEITFTFNSASGAYEMTYVFEEDGYYTISVSCADTYGHESDASVSCFVIDKTAPLVSITYDKTDVLNGRYYASDKELTLTVVEHNFDLSAVNNTSFVFVAKDAAGELIDLSGLKAFIIDANNWTHNGDVHTITLPITLEANYEISLTYTDQAGNVSQNVTDALCVDKTNPSVTIEYSDSVLGWILETITFGFYKASVEVTISASDEISGIDQIVYSYTVENGVSSTNAGGSGSYTNSDRNVKNVSTTFKIQQQFRGKVSATAYDRAGNFVSVTDDTVIIVDQVAPGITVLYEDNDNGFTEGFFNADRTATIRIHESNFFADSLYDSVAQGVDQCLKITVEKIYNDGTTETVNLEPEFMATQVEDVYEAIVTFTEEADYTFTITFSDLSGNTATNYSKSFTIDKTAPVVSVTYDNNTPVNEKYFRTARTATITVTEHNFDANHIISKIRATNSLNEQILNEGYFEYLKTASNWEEIGNDTYQIELVFDEDADYSFDIECSDKAGNNNKNAENETVIDFGDSVAVREFTVDQTKPIAEIQIAWPDQDTVTNWNDFIDAGSITFDLSDNEALTVDLKNTDNLSGLQEVRYFVSSMPKTMEELEAKDDVSWVEVSEREGSFSFVINPEGRYIIYLYVKDMAGNEVYISSNGIILDSTLPDVEKVAPQVIVKPMEQPVNGIYSDSVKIDVVVKDPITEVDGVQIYSGLKVVKYKVYIDNNSDGKQSDEEQTTQSGTLYEYQQGNDVVQCFPQTSNNAVATITIDKNKNNSNNVVVEIIAIDNAGNIKTAKCNLKIDITKPTVEISYSNNAADSGKYFNTDRVATIVVTERNFSADEVKVFITNSEGTIPSLAEWKKTEGTGNGDDTTWTTTVTYSSEGDYTFGISVKDQAGHTADEPDYGTSVAPTEFTIDKTLPIVSVNYDNNSVENGMYYKDDRTATIIINEHNFNPDRVVVTLVATDDGEDITVPVISSWTSDGDRHVATIKYDKDAVYTFDISVSDLAGNSAVDFAEQVFCVDKTDPELNISGIGEFSANNGTVAPIVEYSDTNFDEELVTVTLVGANRGSVDLLGNYENIHNGRKFTFNNFAEEKEVDDIYTLTVTIKDKAGREVSKTLTFSVNRFGSTYEVDEATNAINGSYAKEPVDIVITEVNANELSNIKVTLFKNNKTITLVEGTDYSLEVTGGDEEWYQYVYTIFKSNFTEDGIYRLSVYSEDAAGNIADNTLDTKNVEINFGIDKSAPAIVVMGLESGETYDEESKLVKLSVNDNLLLAKVLVYIDGKEVAVNNPSDGEYEFEILGDTTDAHEIKIVCIDAAGNETVTIIEDVRVTTDQWAQFVSNPVALYGSIGGVLVVLGAVVFLVVYLKKRRK